MRILTVTSSYPKHPGDVTAPFIESIVRALAQHDHAIDVVLPAHPGLKRPVDDPARFYPYQYAPTAGLHLFGYAQSLRADVRLRHRLWLIAPLAAFSLRRMVRSRLASQRYDVAHVHWVIPNAALIAGILKKRRTPIVISLHGSDVFLAERSPLLRAACRSAFARAGAVTACSDDLRTRAIRLGASPEKIRTVPYGVDTAFFTPDNRLGRTRRRFQVPEDATLVVAVGRLVEKKGFACLVEAMARLPRAHLLLIGEGDLRQTLLETARRAGAPVTLTGALDRTNTAAALADADIAVVPSIVDSSGNVDGLPNTLLEALASGCAIVASRVAGIPDVVQDGMNGILVPPKDIDRLSAAIVDLSADSQRRAQLGRAARRTALERLSWDAAARNFEDCFAQAKTLDAR